MQQTELKLELSQTAAIALLKKNPFDSAQRSSAEVDLAGCDLSKRGLSLCIRQSGNERLQTIRRSEIFSARPTEGWRGV